MQRPSPEAVGLPAPCDTDIADTAQPTDLYGATYAVLDAVKARRSDLLKLYKGSHASSQPHHRVHDVGAWVYREQRGLIAFACHMAGHRWKPGIEALDEFDVTFQPRIGVREIFEHLAAADPACSREELLQHLVSRRYDLGSYRGGSSGFDDEARAVAALHFQRTGVDVLAQDVQVYSAGAKAPIMSACAAAMCQRRGEEVRQLGGRVLVPAGYYQSLRNIPPLLGGRLDVVAELDETAVANWLAEGDPTGRVVYAPLVNNANGRVLTTARARGIAGAVATHNDRHPQAPVLIIGDDVYAGSELTDAVDICPIGSIKEVADVTVSIVSPSKTYACPTSRVAFAATRNARLAAQLDVWRTGYAYGRVPQVCEVTAAAALAFTPQAWISSWNQLYQQRFRTLLQGLDEINRDCGSELFHATAPHAGWYVLLEVSPNLCPGLTGIETWAVLLDAAGLGVLPGELFGYPTRGTRYRMRLSLATSPGDLAEAITRLRRLVETLRGQDAAAVTTGALQRARAVADLRQIAGAAAW